MNAFMLNFGRFQRGYQSHVAALRMFQRGFSFKI